MSDRTQEVTEIDEKIKKKFSFQKCKIEMLYVKQVLKYNKNYILFYFIIFRLFIVTFCS